MRTRHGTFHTSVGPPEPGGRVRRTLLPWYAAVLVQQFSVSLSLNTVYYFAGYELHTTTAVLLWIAAAGGLAYLLGAWVGSYWVDRLGQRRVLLTLGLVNLAVFAPAVAGVIWRSELLLGLHVVLLNLSVSWMWPALESAITRSPGRMRLTTRVTLYNLTWAVGAFVAFGLNGALAFWFTWAGVFACAALAMLLAWAIIFRLAIPQHLISAEHVCDDPAEEQHTQQVLASPQSAPLLRMAWVGNMLAYVCSNVITPVMPALTLAAGLRSYALATAVGATWAWARALGFGIGWLWTGWHYRVRWMLIFFALLALTTEALLLNHSLGLLIVLQVVFGLAMAMLYSASLYYSMHLSRGSARQAGIHEAVIGAGTTVGPALAALAGAANALPPKALAIFLVLLCGGSAMGILAVGARGLVSPLPAPAPRGERHAEA